MHYLVDTEQMEAEGLLSAELVAIIKDRSRGAMLALGVNTLLGGGIAAAAGGFVVWLADTVAVAITGSIFLAIGIMILLRAGPMYRMLGNAAGLIGGGMLAGGLTIELLDSASTEVASAVLFAIGAAALGLMLWMLGRHPKARFLIGSIALMAGGMHLLGLYGAATLTGALWVAPLTHLYATTALLGLGYMLDLRLVTALAVAPFAQMLDTSTEYFHAAYVFYSPEPTLSILQMGLAMIAALWLVQNRSGRIARQAGIFAMMTFVIGNLCFLVGSLWGDVVGSSFQGLRWEDFSDWDAYEAAQEGYRQTALAISSGVYSVIWALALAMSAGYAVYRNRRGLFNASLTFAALHAYTQMFESFGDEPLAYVIGGLGAVPLAWGLWRINERFRDWQAAHRA